MSDTFECCYYDANNYSIIECFGKDVTDFLHRVTTNNMIGLSPGHGCQTVLLTEKARIIDVLYTVRLQDQLWWIITHSGRGEIVFQHMRRFIIMDDIRLSKSNQWASIELWFHRDDLLSTPLNEIVSLRSLQDTGWIEGEISQIPVCVGLVHSNRVCPGSEGKVALLLCPPTQKETMGQILQELGIHNLSHHQREFRRVAWGIATVPNEYNDTVNPLEAGLSHLVAFGKGCFIGQEVLERVSVQQKLRQKLWRLTVNVTGEEQLEPGLHLYIHPTDEQSIGIITSLTPLPSTYQDNQMISGLGYVRATVDTNKLWTNTSVQVYLGRPIGQYNY